MTAARERARMPEPTVPSVPHPTSHASSGDPTARGFHDAPHAARPLRIVVADDDPIARVALERALRDEMRLVVVVHAGRAAELASAVRRVAPDAVIVDPAQDWTGGAAGIAALRAAWPGVPVVVFTDAATERLASAATTAAADDFVLKAPLGATRVAAATRGAIERRDAAKRVQDAAAARRAFAPDVPAALWRTTPDGRVVETNAAWRRLFGFADASSVAGVNAAELHVRPDDRARLREALEREGAVRDFEYEARRADGATFWASTNASAVRDAAGAVVHHDACVVDVTARRRAEAELAVARAKLLEARKLDALGRLASGVAHDFNNLLATIEGYAELARRHAQGGTPAAEFLDEIRDSAALGADLTRRLLAFGGRRPVLPRLLDVNEVARDTAHLMRRVVGDDVQIALRLAPHACPVFADAGEMEQLVMALAAHARDALPRGGEMILSTTDSDVDDATAAPRPGLAIGRCVVLAATYGGADAARSAAGSALNGALDIVRANNGHVEIDAGPQTVVRVRLPRASAAPAAPPVVEREAAKARGDETVLVVEDDDRLRFIVRTILEDAGYSVIAARDDVEAEAAARVAPRPPDVVVADMMLAGSRGPSVVDRLEAAGAKIPALFVSGHDRASLAGRGLLAPHAAYLAKPFSSAQLLARVRELLDRR